MMAVHQEARTIEAFERAVREHAFRGAQMPEAHAEIDAQYYRAKTRMYELLGLSYRMPDEDGA